MHAPRRFQQWVVIALATVWAATSGAGVSV